MGFSVPERKSIPELEEETLKFWKSNNIFKKSVENRSENDLYVFYDGPPFISGLPHYGHLLSSIAKDLVPRYFTMKGKRVERVWGWDAHGLTVENRVQDELGIKNRRDIENYGLEKFTKACYEYTSRVSAEWEWYVDRIGRWVDFTNAYKTIDQSYMESVIWAFSELYKKGFIYEGTRTSLFCTTCGTPVSDFEIAMDNSYKEVEDPSIIVKFRVITEGDLKDAYILAWTTTPWTIPSNRALVVDEKEEYVLVLYEEFSYIVAKPRLKETFRDGGYEIKKEFKGSKLVGLRYEPPFRIFKSKNNEYAVYSFEGMVSMEEGTGIVHSAPGFGEIDTEMGRHYDLTLMLTIDDEGNFLAGTEEENPYQGVFYLKANEQINRDLEEKGLLFRNETGKHRVPYHDRCNTVLVQKAQSSWFIDIEKNKKELLKQNENINWVPEHIKHGQFEKTMEQAPDWCVSRNRFWATPMPVWESEDGDRIVVSSVKELEDLSGQKIEDLHRPFIDNIVINKKGKEYKRRPEVLDSWMEAGSMPYAQFHYPFENKEKFEKNYPGDFIVEYVGQVRAWFQRMHIMSTLLFDSNSFKNVVVTGVMAGADGRKMSKTYKNYTDPKEVLQNYGGDALRLFLMSSPLMIGENFNFDEEELKTKSRNIINPLWNSVRFFLMYAEHNDWDPKDSVESRNILDKWVISRVNEVMKEFSENMDKYVIPNAVRAVEDFVDDLSRWYVRRSRNRISSGDNEALSTLYYVLTEYSKVAAPIISFISETIYQNLVIPFGDCPESVHLCDYPKFEKKLIDADLNENMKKARDLSSIALAQRTEKGIPVRQALSKLSVPVETKLPEEYIDIVKDEINVKEIVIDKSIEEPILDTEITEELKLEGLAREMVRKIQDLRKEAGLSISDRVKVFYKKDEETSKVVEKYGNDIKGKVLADRLEPSEEYRVERL